MPLHLLPGTNAAIGQFGQMMRWLLPPSIQFGTPVQRITNLPGSTSIYWHVPVIAKPRFWMAPSSLDRCRIYLELMPPHKGTFPIWWGDAVGGQTGEQASIDDKENILVPIACKASLGKAVYFIDGQFLQQHGAGITATAENEVFRFKLRVSSRGKSFQADNEQVYRLRCPGTLDNDDFSLERESETVTSLGEVNLGQENSSFVPTGHSIPQSRRKSDEWESYRRMPIAAVVTVGLALFAYFAGPPIWNLFFPPALVGKIMTYYGGNDDRGSFIVLAIEIDNRSDRQVSLKNLSHLWITADGQTYEGIAQAMPRALTLEEPNHDKKTITSDQSLEARGATPIPPGGPLFGYTLWFFPDEPPEVFVNRDVLVTFKYSDVAGRNYEIVGHPPHPTVPQNGNFVHVPGLDAPEK